MVPVCDKPYYMNNGFQQNWANIKMQNLFILTIDYSTSFTTSKLLTIGHMPLFVVKSIVIQINGLGCVSIN